MKKIGPNLMINILMLMDINNVPCCEFLLL